MPLSVCLGMADMKCSVSWSYTDTGQWTKRTEDYNIFHVHSTEGDRMFKLDPVFGSSRYMDY